jgi:hypothetical protein
LEFLKTQGFEPLTSDLGIFSKSYMYIVIYVNDLLIAGPNMGAITELKDALSKRFEMSDLGEYRYHLGMEIIRDRPQRTLRLSQKGYVTKILSDFDMQECKPNSTPMAVAHLEPAPDGVQAPEDLTTWYARAIGSLMYLMLNTRPDIAFAVSCLSCFMANPTEQHCTAIKHLFRYLQGTCDFVLIYKGNLKPLLGYTDANWGRDVTTRRSTSE